MALRVTDRVAGRVVASRAAGPGDHLVHRPTGAAGRRGSAAAAGRHRLVQRRGASTRPQDRARRAAAVARRRGRRAGRLPVDRTRLTAVVVVPRRTGVTRSRRGVVVPRRGRLDLFLDRSAHVQQAGVSVGWSGSNVHDRITGTRDEHGILSVSCLVVPSCHLALLVPARPRCSGHSCLSWRRFSRPRTWLIGFGRGMSPTGTVGAATQPTPTGGSGIPARWCDSRLSSRTSRGTHGPSTPTRMRRTRLPRPAALEERHRGAGGETRGPGPPKMSVDRSEGERGRRPRRLTFVSYPQDRPIGEAQSGHGGSPDARRMSTAAPAHARGQTTNEVGRSGDQYRVRILTCIPGGYFTGTFPRAPV